MPLFQVSPNSNEWFSRNRRDFFHSMVIFDFTRMRASNLVLLVTKKELRIAGFVASLPFFNITL